MIARYRKAIAALVGAALIAVSQGLVVGTAAKWVAIVVAALTSAGVYLAPNVPAADVAPAKKPATRARKRTPG